MKDESLLPPILRDRAPAGRWPLELRLQLAEALASGLRRGETLTAIAAKHGVSQGALSKSARKLSKSLGSEARSRR